MTFEHNFEKEKNETQLKEKPMTIMFKASVEGLTTLKDGGVNLRLGLSGGEYANIAKLCAVKDNNELIDIVAQVTTPDKLGGNV